MARMTNFGLILPEGVDEARTPARAALFGNLTAASATVCRLDPLSPSRRRLAALALVLLAVPVFALALPGTPVASAPPPPLTPLRRSSKAVVPTLRTPDREVAHRAVASLTRPVDAVLSDATLSPELLKAVGELEGSKRFPKPKEGGLGGYRLEGGEGLGRLATRGGSYDPSVLQRREPGVAVVTGVDLEGALSRAEIDVGLRRNVNAVRYCYLRELPRDPELAGEATFSLDVTPDGTVSTVTSEGTIDEKVRLCVTGRLRRMELPAHDAASRVKVSWRFSPG